MGRPNASRAQLQARNCRSGPRAPLLSGVGRGLPCYPCPRVGKLKVFASKKDQRTANGRRRGSHPTVSNRIEAGLLLLSPSNKDST